MNRLVISVSLLCTGLERFAGSNGMVAKIAKDSLQHSDCLKCLYDQRQRIGICGSSKIRNVVLRNLGDHPASESLTLIETGAGGETMSRFKRRPLNHHSIQTCRSKNFGGIHNGANPPDCPNPGQKGTWLLSGDSLHCLLMSMWVVKT